MDDLVRQEIDVGLAVYWGIGAQTIRNPLRPQTYFESSSFSFLPILAILSDDFCDFFIESFSLDFSSLNSFSMWTLLTLQFLLYGHCQIILWINKIYVRSTLDFSLLCFLGVTWKSVTVTMVRKTLTSCQLSPSCEAEEQYWCGDWGGCGRCGISRSGFLWIFRLTSFKVSEKVWPEEKIPHISSVFIPSPYFDIFVDLSPSSYVRLTGFRTSRRSC